ncbi:unnamed protein product, partial [Symbiodinium sp. KB8]
AVWLFRRLVKDHLQPDLVTYTSMISACDKAHRPDWALELLHDLQGSDLQTDTVAYNAAIGACEKEARWESSILLFAKMAQRFLEASLLTRNSVLGCCQSAGQWQWALHLLTEWSASEEVDLISYNSTMAACERGGRMGQWQRVVDLLRSLSTRRLEADGISRLTTVCACAKAAQWQYAIRVLQGFPCSEGLLPERLLTCNAALGACSRASQWQWTIQLLAGMEEIRLQATTITDAAVAEASERVGSTSLLTT